MEEKRGGAPTEKWSALRADFAGTLGACLRLGCDDLFAFYPDANLRDDEALNSYFRGNSDGSAEDVGRMVTAFTAVRDIAKFDAIEVEEDEPPEESTPRRENGGAKAKGAQLGFSPASNAPTININIQLQLPSDTTGEVYEKFFEAMRSKLFNGG